MLIDSFLFFQELDLLEIRLEYLSPYIDKFIIVESCQTFKGEKKAYNFEINKKRFEKYLSKIIYYKIDSFFEDSFSLISSLSRNKEELFIYNFLKKHDYYEKHKFHFLLDSYHRECIHIPLKAFASDTDTIIFSDLDEVPNINFVKHLKSDKCLSRLIVANQFEFKYFLNSLSSENWLGSIAGKYYALKKESLNLLRRNSSKLDKYNFGGYHFTSIGGEKLLKLKIENWGHQEFNIPIIKKNINKNINYGKDVFYRFGIKKNILIDLKINKLFDERISRILEKYNNLIIKNFKKESLIDIYEYKLIQIFIYLKRIIKNPIKAFFKILKLLNSTLIYLPNKRLNSTK